MDLTRVTIKRFMLAAIVVVAVAAATTLGYADTDRVLWRLGLVR